MILKTFSNTLQKMRCIEQKLIKEFEKNTGFSLTRYEILIYIDEHTSSLQNEIADHVGLDPAAVTRQLKILEKKGYVIRNRNENNAREVIVTLSDFARDELAKCKKRQSENEYNLPVPLSKEDIEHLMKVLEDIEKKL